MRASSRDAGVVEIEACDGPVAFGGGGFFDDLLGAAAAVEGDDAVAFGVADLVGEDGCAFGPGGGGAEEDAEVVAEDEVVAEGEGAGLAVDPFLADVEGLGEAVRARLFGVGEADAEAVAVAQQALEARQIDGG